MKMATVYSTLLWFTYLCIFFDVGTGSLSGSISVLNGTYPMASHEQLQVSDTMIIGNRRPTKITKSTTIIIRRCCINGDCRELGDGETCGPSATSFSNEENKKQRLQISSTDVSGKKPKIKSSSHVTPVGFNDDKLVTRFRNQVLSKSNFYRQKYGISSLSMDEKLNGLAQDWANWLAVTGERRHRPSNPYGENIYYTTAELDNLGEEAVDGWFKEIKMFNGNDDEWGLIANIATHHMTQLLWKSSSKLGVGVSKNPFNKFKYIVVANYDPPGNVIGHFKINLPKIKSHNQM